MSSHLPLWAPELLAKQMHAQTLAEILFYEDGKLSKHLSENWKL